MTSSTASIAESRDREALWRGAAFAVLIVVAVAAIVTFRDYGLTWDETYHATYSEEIVAWFTSGFQHREALDDSNRMDYSGFADLLGWIAARAAGSSSSYYEARHLVTIVFGLIGLVATYRLAALVAGARAGALAIAALALTPLYYGHLFNNPKDIPFAALSACALYAIVASSRELPRVSVKGASLVAATIGLTLAVRPGGVFLFGYTALLWLAVLGHRWRTKLPPSVPELARTAATLLLVYVIAWVLMLTCWPWGQIAPVGHPLQAMVAATHFGFGRSQWFLGRFVGANPPPRSYIPVWFGVLLPEFHFVAWTAGLAVLFFGGGGGDHADASVQKILEVGFITFAALFPPAGAILLRSTLYDGVRHLMFILPPLSALTGIALSTLIEQPSMPRWVKAGFLGVAGVSAVATIAELPKLHPYEAIYFNRLVGGLPGAASRLETDYWGLSYREGIEWVMHHPPSSDRPLAVANCSAPFLSEYFLQKNPRAASYLRHVTADDPHDILLATTRWHCQQTPGEVLHVVRREGVPLLYVIRRDPPAAGTAAVR